ncbi:hypothetical protein [Jiangella alkaliphila]|uniref:Aromatic-ring-opening dioxygenase LigAB, LigA subunit n=1 Tax=Jiangella alkaliphila TaxID=419479 RepID=A0A1H2G4G6_9ACTN|nr:hypothetical protein [Jiangella alkaliphila]SDU14444.1 hypothetical protein SAMN04488563_0285 [Jiangella alkaliphila]
MSTYMMNKFMRAVEMSDDAVRAYVADPAAFVDAWLAGAAGPDRRTDDRVLTDAERAAFAARNYAALYALGAHPYLLWHFTEAVYIHEVPWPELNERYREAVRPSGYPDAIV